MILEQNSKIKYTGKSTNRKHRANASHFGNGAGNRGTHGTNFLNNVLGM